MKAWLQDTWVVLKRWLAKAWEKCRGYIGALVALGVVIAAIFMGSKRIKTGGILGKMMGKDDPKDPKKTIERANSVDEDRVDDKGKPIEIGTADSKGHTQAPVVPIEDPGIFSDPNKVVFTPPGETKPIEVVLPDGVTNKDVDQVVVVNPKVTDVKVTDTSGVKPSRVDELLKKYKK